MTKDSEIKGMELDFKNKRKTYFKSNYEEKNHSNWLRFERRELINQWLGNIKNIRFVLDIGCGPAMLYPDALMRCEKYWALDLVDTNLEEISTSSSKISTIMQNIDEFSWNDKANPSVIISSGSLEYSQNGVDNVNKLMSALDENGVLIASFPNRSSPFRIWTEFVHLPLKRVLSFSRDQSAIYKRSLYRFDRIVKEIEGSGGVIVEVKWLGYLFIPYPISLLSPRLVYKMNKWIEKKLPSFDRYASEFVIYAVKKDMQR